MYLILYQHRNVSRVKTNFDIYTYFTSAVLTLPGPGHLVMARNVLYSQVLRSASHFPDRLPDVHTLPRVGQFHSFWQYWHFRNTQ